jgi:ATP-dependent RNA helicase DHX29
MTTGSFLMKLINSTKFLNEITHIIIDEVHEREIDTEILLVLLKILLG